MAQIKFVKYNRTRKEQFQIKTVIAGGETPDQWHVEKTALRPEGKAHICSFSEKFQALSRQYQGLSFAEPEISPDGMTAVFPYLQGKTLAETLGEEIQGGKAPLEALEKAMGLVYNVPTEYERPFDMTDAFRETFGCLEQDPTLQDHGAKGNEEQTAVWVKEILAGPSYAVSNIDALFENMLVTAEGVFCLDYEWVYDFPIPVSFLKYRTLAYFYEKYESLMDYETMADFLTEFQITPEMILVYQAMERGFQEAVHGINQRIYLENYMVKTKNATDLAQVDSELDRAKAELREKSTTIHKVQEVQRLTNNHVANLEIMIRDLRHEIDEQAKLLAYLNRHEALIFKIRRKLGQAFNNHFPKGTKTRKKLSYVKRAVFHPVQTWRLFTTEEGKNLVDGDFQIGDSYRLHGKLKFPKVENPKVSIIIPVYNQIHYTYDCLVSILHHTEHVSYEVIIADDVSTDATEHLSQYAENLIICRNSTNQGFLKNCNQAAKAAKGQYIMFLNNDTQVTEHWLSSLVELIESDSTIGMVGSKLVYPDGRLQEAGGIIWSDGSGWNYGRLDDPEKPEYNYVKDVDYISGAAILLSRKLWNEIGGFDERFAPAYCEDSDLAFAVRKAGYRVVYQPRSKVIHFEGISNGTDVEGSGLKRYQVVNSQKLKEKWASEFAKQCENTGNPDPFRARERSMGKEIILVVDHYVPTYDKDAGSKTTFQYLKMFLKKGYVVKFLGDNFLHEEPYTTTLQQMGIEVLYGEEYRVKIWDWLKEHGKDVAYAYLNRPHIAGKYIDYIKDNTDMKIIYYGHDLHFLRESREYALTDDVTKRQQAEYWKSIEIGLMCKADMSYYPSYIERDAIHEIDPNIKVKDITAYVYEDFKTQLETDFTRRKGLLFVGGFAHAPNADGVLWFVKEIYPLIRRQLDIPFYIVGSKATEEIKALEQPGNGIIVKGFVSEEELERLYATCRMVVVPLRYGAGVKGKVVEAIYNGAPIVTTSVGAEGIPEIEDVVVMEDRPDRFAQAVVSLYQDTGRCQELCEKTQVYIKEHFSMDGAWNVIEEDFRR